MMDNPLFTSAPMIVFTDLDGTLLDHNTYSFEPALSALGQIKKLNIPLIINSSKTRVEIIAMQKLLGICQPFIVENGAAVYWPADEQGVQWERKAFASSRCNVLTTIAQMRQENGYQVKGFADYSPEEIADITGLSLEQAALAATREFSEPLQWLGEEQQKQAFKQHLHERGFVAEQGGRFLTVMHGENINKGVAMRWLINCYEDSATMKTVALGDSPNDIAMLNEADIAVVVRSKKSDQLRIDTNQYVVRTNLEGPAGWQEAMGPLLVSI